MIRQRSGRSWIPSFVWNRCLLYKPAFAYAFRNHVVCSIHIVGFRVDINISWTELVLIVQMPSYVDIFHSVYMSWLRTYILRERRKLFLTHDRPKEPRCELSVNRQNYEDILHSNEPHDWHMSCVIRSEVQQWLARGTSFPQL